MYDVLVYIKTRVPPGVAAVNVRIVPCDPGFPGIRFVVEQVRRVELCEFAVLQKKMYLRYAVFTIALQDFGHHY